MKTISLYMSLWVKLGLHSFDNILSGGNSCQPKKLWKMQSSTTCTLDRWIKHTSCFCGTQILDLVDFQAASINLFQELKQISCKEWKETPRIISHQKVNITNNEMETRRKNWVEILQLIRTKNHQMFNSRFKEVKQRLRKPEQRLQRWSV